MSKPCDGVCPDCFAATPTPPFLGKLLPAATLSPPPLLHHYLLCLPLARECGLGLLTAVPMQMGKYT